MWAVAVKKVHPGWSTADEISRYPARDHRNDYLRPAWLFTKAVAENII